VAPSLPEWLRRRRAAARAVALARWAGRVTARLDVPRLIERPPGERILVLSPHPDDDVLGAGGTLAKHAAAGAAMTALVLTDGRAGPPRTPGVDGAAVRRREARAAAAVVGIGRVEFWDEPDGSLRTTRASAGRLADLLAAVRPDLVYLPSFLDAHPDHRQVTPLLAAALPAGGPAPACAVYEVTTPVVPTVVVDVTAEMPVKLRAVAAHASQAEDLDYVEVVRGLNRWRAATLGRRAEYAEAFWLGDVREYLALWRRAGAPG
jgi:LmbE family N-acetylglucosaminyl deacetylase